MGNAGLLKRALPFLATFGLGLFVASFFVNISPRFEHHERGRCHRDMWEMRIENEQLREENKRLRESQDSSRVYPVLPPVNLEDDEFRFAEHLNYWRTRAGNATTSKRHTRLS